MQDNHALRIVISCGHMFQYDYAIHWNTWYLQLTVFACKGSKYHVFQNLNIISIDEEGTLKNWAHIIEFVVLPSPFPQKRILLQHFISKLTELKFYNE